MKYVFFEDGEQEIDLPSFKITATWKKNTSPWSYSSSRTVFAVFSKKLNVTKTYARWDLGREWSNYMSGAFPKDIHDELVAEGTAYVDVKAKAEQKELAVLAKKRRQKEADKLGITLDELKKLRAEERAQARLKKRGGNVKKNMKNFLKIAPVLVSLRDALDEKIKQLNENDFEKLTVSHNVKYLCSDIRSVIRKLDNYIYPTPEKKLGKQ